MISIQATWNWTKEHQKTFEHKKISISKETLLLFSNFSKPFVIHTEVSSAVVSPKLIK